MRSTTVMAGLAFLLTHSALSAAPGGGAPPSVTNNAPAPYSGWSSFSQQTLASEFLTQANMQAQSDALKSSGLQAHGYNYLNLDSGWQGSFDQNGRPIPNTAIFPDIKALFDHLHRNGQKAGIYWIPGVEQPAVDANSPILGTPYHIRDILAVPYTAGNAFGGAGTSPYHYKIDFTKPGAQEYIDSVVALFAAWGVDFIKLDGVTPGSYSDDLHIDNRADVAAWSNAIQKSGRPIWFTISWQLDKDYIDVWQRYANARRIDDDVECEGRCATLTNWPRIYKRLRDLPAWQDAAGPRLGWNDLDTLDIADGALDGLTTDEKKAAFTTWAMANAPLYLGGDLTKLDPLGKEIATNDEVLALDRSRHPAVEKIGGDHPVWVSDQGNGIFYVALFNTNMTPENVHVAWRDLGLTGGVQLRDVWSHADMPVSLGDYTTRVEGHGVRLLRVTGIPGVGAGQPATPYEAETATLSGSAAVAACANCSGGSKVGGLGLGAANTVTFNQVRVPRSGVYQMQVDSMTLGLRSYQYRVNGGLFRTLNSGGGSFNIPSSNTVPVCLKAGLNSIEFGNPTSYPPDLDRIVIKGDGRSALPSATTYEAENAALGDGVTAGFSNYASGLSKAGNIGGSATRTVTFSNITVPVTGTYQLEIDYMTSGERSFSLSINGAAAKTFPVNGSSFDDPAVAILEVQLKAGVNTIQYGNPTGNAPDLDRLVVAPWIDHHVQTAETTQRCG